MAQRIRQIKIESFLVSKGIGKINLEQSLARLQRLCDVWEKTDGENVLFDLRDRTFDLNTSDIKKLMQAFSQTNLGRANKVALLYRHREGFDAAVFFSFLAEAKGLQVKAFDNHENALNWLISVETPIAHIEKD